MKKSIHFSKIGVWHRIVHHHLRDEDECFYLFELMRGQDPKKDKTKSLISNLKKKPGVAQRELAYKRPAIIECAQYISQAMSDNWIENVTFVPIPPSKSIEHPQYDDRMEQVCRQIADGIDVRTLLKQDTPIKAAHERRNEERPKVYELKMLWRVDETLSFPRPKGIVIVDDVLTSGAHFRTAHDMLSQKFPDIPIAGVFIARRIIAERPASEADPDYKVYLNTHDQEIAAEDLEIPKELKRLRAKLDQQLGLEPLKGAVNRLTDILQRRLQAQQRSWEFDREEREEGILDIRHLPRVVSNQTTSPSFKVEKETEFRDTVVTLLLDNSSSMHGCPISIAAICADVLARTLERCNVKVEILGFTTRAWKGGEARKAWLKNGCPPTPGRLNDLRHIIYKDAETPWCRARPNLGLMMKKDLLKENIDGEALEWAHRRMLERCEARKILMVISDGTPLDQSTLYGNGNPPTYLKKHLCDVIAMIKNLHIVEVLAIGIGHDVTRYYDCAVTITDIEQLAGAVTEQLVEKLARMTH